MVAVALPGGGVQKRIGCFLGTRQHRHGICMDDAGKFAAHHFMQMAEKAEAGHIRSGMDAVFAADLCRRFVQSGHGADGGFHLLRGGFAHTVCRAQQPHTQSLGQYQLVARHTGVVRIHPLRVNKAGHGKAVFYPAVRNGMPACKTAAGFRHLFGTTAQNFAQHIQVHILRETDQIQGSLYLAAHGIDITQGVRGCNLPKGIGVIHHRREKIHGLHQRNVICNAVDCGIIPAVVADQKIRVFFAPGQLFQNTAQHSGTQLCGAAAPGTEYDLIFLAHARSSSLKCVNTHGMPC